MIQSPLRDKAFAFALRIVRLYKYMCETKKEYVLSKQILRSGTSIGANVAEGFYGQSDADFISKMSIAQKETAETTYWLELLHKSEYISDEQFESIYNDVVEVQKLLTTTIKKMKAKRPMPNT